MFQIFTEPKLEDWDFIKHEGPQIKKLYLRSFSEYSFYKDVHHSSLYNYYCRPNLLREKKLQTEWVKNCWSTLDDIINHAEDTEVKIKKLKELRELLGVYYYFRVMPDVVSP
jgi:L-rhamnose mutarotase